MLDWKQANPTGTFHEYIVVRKAALCATTPTKSICANFPCPKHTCPENIDLNEDGSVAWMDDRLLGSKWKGAFDR
jgi:hypothetical protein